MATDLEQAFHAVCLQAEAGGQRWYVALVEEAPFYGGPEEGGWWGADLLVHAFKAYPTQAEADEVCEQIKQLAAEQTEAARVAYGEACELECEWLEARGLEPDFLPEPDGPSTFDVIVTDRPPENRYSPRHYE